MATFLLQILCVSGASEAAADAQVKVNVKVSGVSNAKDLDFSYDDAITPKVSCSDNIFVCLRFLCGDDFFEKIIADFAHNLLERVF